MEHFVQLVGTFYISYASLFDALQSQFIRILRWYICLLFTTFYKFIVYKRLHN